MLNVKVMEPSVNSKMDRPPVLGAIFLSCWALGSTIVGRIGTALIPSPFDAHHFAYIGLKWLHGSIPYVDIWDNKPPGIFAANALVFLLFPKSFTALACVEGIFIIGCIATVYLLMRHWGAPWLVASLATASVAVVANLNYYNVAGNMTEIYLLWPATLSMYFFSKTISTFQLRWIFLAGLFSGVASLFKPPGLAPLLAQGTFVFLLWAVYRRLSLRHLMTSTLMNTAGVLAAWAPIALYFWMHGALKELVNASFIYNFQYRSSSQQFTLSQLLNIASELRLLATLVICALIGSVLYVTLRTVSRRNPGVEVQSAPALSSGWALVLLWVFFDLAGALAGGRNYSHYYLTLAPSLSVAAGFTYWFLVDRIPDEKRFWGVKQAIFALIIGHLILVQVFDIRKVRVDIMHTTSTDKKSREFEALIAVTTFLNTTRSPQDTLFTWNYLPLIYFVTEMNSPTRLLDAHYIFDFPESHRAYGEDILHQLKQTPPTFIIDAARTKEETLLSNWVYRQFREFLESRYVLIYTANGHCDEGNQEDSPPCTYRLYKDSYL